MNTGLSWSAPSVVEPKSYSPHFNKARISCILKETASRRKISLRMSCSISWLRQSDKYIGCGVELRHSQRAQYGLIKENTVNHILGPHKI